MQHKKVTQLGLKNALSGLGVHPVMIKEMHGRGFFSTLSQALNKGTKLAYKEAGSQSKPPLKAKGIPSIVPPFTEPTELQAASQTPSKRPARNKYIKGAALPTAGALATAGKLVTGGRFGQAGREATQADISAKLNSSQKGARKSWWGRQPEARAPSPPPKSGRGNTKWIALVTQVRRDKGFKTIKETIKYIKDNNLYKK